MEPSPQKPAVARDDVDVRPGGEDGELRLEESGLPQIVAVEDRDELPGGVLQSCVARGRNPAVLTVVDANPGVGVGPGLRRLHRVVGRAVVHDDQLPVLERLRQDGGDRRSDIRGDVEGGHHYADCRHRSSSGSDNAAATAGAGSSSISR
jgi:hypothetical protein